MESNVFINHPYLLISFLSFLLNIPCGFFREANQKFSLKWWLWIHASIPVILYMRIALGTAKLFIPVCILLAVLGQLVGSRFRRSRMTESDREREEKLPDLRLNDPTERNIADDDVLVALLNMGGPQTIADVKPFLLRLFSDSLIIRFPFSPWLQSFWANLLVNARYKETEKRYGRIGGGSPIYRSTAAQSDALAQELRRRGRNIAVTFSFNYSPPLPEDTVHEAKSAGKKYLLPLSLYPHYSLATTGSNLHYLKKAAAKTFPGLNFLKARPYYLDDSYIWALVERIREQIRPGESLDDFYLLFSAHGTPFYFLAEGDPYAFEINQTVAKIIDRLGRIYDWALCYQSAVGPIRWLKPTTEAMLKALAKKGVKKVLVVPVSFVSDHIETICEIDLEYRAVAEGAGIVDFRMSRALETHPEFIKALADCVEDALGRKPGVLKKIVQTILAR